MELFHNKDAVLTIEEGALSKIIECTTKDRNLEAGGILLGRKSAAGDTYSIVDVGQPSELDRRTSISFIRSKVSAKKLVDKAWHNSGGVNNHIGEWHSHTFDYPIPSFQDKRDMARAYNDGEYVFDYFFTVIISRDFQIFSGLVSQGSIVDYNIIRVGREICTDTVQMKIRKRDGRPL